MTTKPARSSRAKRGVPSGITVTTLATRSTNLERDIHRDDFPDLYIGVRTQEALERLVMAMVDADRSRAWSLTGPYGSGKSTFALLVDALLAPAGQRNSQAQRILAAANPSLAKRLNDGNARWPGGFLGAVVTARREPLVRTVTRALTTAVTRRWPKKAPAAVSAAVGNLSASDTGSAEVLRAVVTLCQFGPLLLVIDEFGKTLEHLAGHAGVGDDDLYLLQELAEMGAGSAGAPLFLFTLQHLSFLDYASSATIPQSREWAKIQGRFEDVTFTTHLGDALQLLARALDHAGVTAAGSKLIERQAGVAARLWAELGLHGVLPTGPDLLRSLYPLHPLTAVAAPLLAAQIGQNDRSIAGFLGADEPHSVRRFMAARDALSSREAATVHLVQLYDYFLGSGRTTVLASANASRWIEIDVRIGEAHGLPAEDMAILKTIGLLNLVDSSGALRASEDMVCFALHDPDVASDRGNRDALRERLAGLISQGFLVYREFSDEYRVWRGTDVDIKARVDDLLDQADDRAIAGLIAERIPAAVVAGRHSQRTGLLRHFITAVSTPNTPPITGPLIGDSADGLMLYHLGSREDLPAVTSELPVIVGVTQSYGDVVEEGRQLWALNELLTDSTIDAVARAEVQERASQRSASLAKVFGEAYSPGNPKTAWSLLPAQRGIDAEKEDFQSLMARSLAGMVSAACEIVYDQSPTIHNEMLGRHQLTSQGAKARRELIAAIIEHSADEYLGIDGYGPERAMYSGVVEPLGLHRQVETDSKDLQHSPSFQLTPPDPGTSLYPAWIALQEGLATAAEPTPVENITRSILAPPFGIKAGVAPLVVVTALLLHREDIAIFEEGSYVASFTAEAAERLLKGPGRFTVKAVANSRGQRKLLLKQLSNMLAIAHDGPLSRAKGRNSALLVVTRALLDPVRTLPPFAQKTQQLSGVALAVRDAILTNRDPDDLVFTALPSAVKFDRFSATSKVDPSAAEDCARHIVDALHELTTFQETQRLRALATIARSFRLPTTLPELRRDFRARVRGLQGVLLEPGLKGLVRHALGEGIEDDEWLDPLIIRISGAGIANWNDAQSQQFETQTQQMARALDRVSYLAQGAHLDQSADGFTAQLVTVTRPDGSEERALVHIPDEIKSEAHDLAARCLLEAKARLGADGARVLLASLAEALMPTIAGLDAETAPSTGRSHQKKVSL